MILPEQEEVAGVLGRVFDAYTKSKGAIRPHFILSGESGSGKSHLISTLAKEREIQMLEVNAAGLTKEGVSGNSLSKALAPLRGMVGVNGIVIFVDEFDKLFTNGVGGETHEALAGVQNEFLTMLESSTASVFGDYGKYEKVSVEHVLFVFAGAFNGEANLTHERMRELGVRTEFLGRVALHFSTIRPSLQSLLDLVPESRLLDEYIKAFGTGKNLSQYKKKVINEVQAQLKMVYKTNAIGVRVVNQLIHRYFLQV